MSGYLEKINSNSNGARPVRLIITMIKWIRTSRLTIENSLSAGNSIAKGAQVGADLNSLAEICIVSEAGSCLKLIDSCITQRKAQGPSRTCNKSKEEEEDL